MTYNDLRLLNDSFGNLNDVLLRQQMMKEQRAERQASEQRMEQDAAATAAYRQQELAERNRHNSEEEALRRSMLDLETTKAGTAKENADTAAKKAGQTSMFKWTGEDGVDYSAKDPAEFGQLIKEHPAKKEDDGTHTLTMTGTDPNTGVTFHQTLKVPADSEQAKGVAKNAITNFVQTTGAAPRNPHVDASRNRLAADYIMAQNKENPTNTVQGIMGQYDQATGVPPMPNGAPTIQPQTPTVTSQDQYDALPSGSQYMDSSGNLRKKK